MSQHFGRKPISKGKSKRSFSKTASLTHFMNIKPRPMRGGIRL